MQSNTEEESFFCWCETRNVSRETAKQLSDYVELLKKWTQKLNLISKTTINDIWSRHILDSAQLMEHINPELPILDVGSGAGLPGVVLALLGCKEVHLVEADLRKVQFLKICIQQFRCHATAHHLRLEKMKERIFPIITSRACASLEALLQMTEKFRNEETLCLFPKGKKYSTELEKAKRCYEFELDVIPSVTSPDGVILHISKIRRRT